MTIKFKPNGKRPSDLDVKMLKQGLHPRWVDITPRVMNRRLAEGYRNAQEGEAQVMGASWLNGVYTTGDAVLMVISKEKLADRRAMKDYHANAQVESVKAGIQKTGGSLNNSNMTLQETLDTN